MRNPSQLPVAHAMAPLGSSSERAGPRRSPRAAARRWGLACAFLAAGMNSAAAANSYSYDRLGRLTSAFYESGLCVVYSYDANGNRTAITSISVPPGTPTWGAATFGCFVWTP